MGLFKKLRKSLSDFDGSLRGRLSDFDDSVRNNARRLDDERRETYQGIEEQASDYFSNPWEWRIKTFLPDVIAQPVESMVGLGDDPRVGRSAGQGGGPGGPPGLDRARAAALDIRARRRRTGVGSGANILSERPTSLLGYTGGGTVSNILLGG